MMKKQKLIVWGISVLAVACGMLLAGCGSAPSGASPKAAAVEADAQFFVGSAYYTGLGVELDLREAVYWWTKAAEQGHAVAQVNLGSCYHEGEGV